MKKFYNKINNKQWRVTVPNINNSVFKRGVKNIQENSKNTGFYDIQEAEKEFEKSRSVPTSVLLVESSSEDESRYHVAEGEGNERHGDVDEENGHLYTDVELIKHQTIEEEDAEYDVPRISFKFFEKPNPRVEEYDNTYENVKEEEMENCDSAQDSNYEIVSKRPTTPKRIRSEMKIVLTAVEIDIGEETPSSNDVNHTNLVPRTRKSRSRSISEEFVSSTSIKLSTQSPNGVSQELRKCGSDPNVNATHNVDAEDEENFYKVPRSLKQKRYSQSLKDFNIEEVGETSGSSHYFSNSSIEHVSCSQILQPCDQTYAISEPNDVTDSNSLSYTKDKFKFSRLNILKKPHSSKWYNWKTKLNDIMLEQAAHQRVGAFEDKTNKLTINMEEVYRNSKSKCKTMIKNTGKIFNRRKNLTNLSTEASSPNNSSDVSELRTELKACDIEYKLNLSECSESKDSEKATSEQDNSMDLLKNVDFGTIKSAFGKIKTSSIEGQNGFDDLRRYVKQGSDFCKELSTILQDRAEAEAAYSKSLSKLSSKLSRACREGVGTLNEGWKAVAQELETRAESHRLLGVALSEEAAKPLRLLTENQQKSRKHAENSVDKAAKSLSEWRAGEAKSKKNSHSCARENEKLQDAAILDNSRISRSTSLIHLGSMQKNTTDKENSKLESKKKKAEGAVKKADVEYYTLCVRAERARLEWESAVLRGVDTFQSLEEERLNTLKISLMSYLQHSSDHGPRLIEAIERLKIPTAQSESTKDLTTFINLRQTSQQISEQLLPDFYCEHITLAMNRERRKQALIKLLHLIRQDIERERKSKSGLENLSKAIKQTPNFGAEDSQQSVIEKLYHMKSMLTYLEAARYKVQNALAELDSRPRTGHPLAPHITITRDKSGLQQSVLKVPQWLREELIDCDKSPVSEKSVNSAKSDLHMNDNEDPPDWTDRGAADGNSNQPDSDFDEFSSQCSSTEDIKHNDDTEVQPIAQCKAIYPYTPNLNDELALKPGDVLSVYRQQDDGWWLGECNGNVGIFPATYVEILPAAS